MPTCKVLGAFVTLLTLQTVAYAREDDPQGSANKVSSDNSENSLSSVNAAFNGFGYTSKIVTEQPCRVEMTLDQGTLIKSMPDILAAKMLNPEVVNQTMINTQPSVISMVFAMQMISSVVRGVYEEDKKVDKCQFNQILIQTDDYGQDKKESIFTFDFNRKLDDRINWDKFDNSKIQKVAPNFKFSPSFVSKAAREHEAAE